MAMFGYPKMLKKMQGKENDEKLKELKKIKK